MIIVLPKEAPNLHNYNFQHMWNARGLQPGNHGDTCHEYIFPHGDIFQVVANATAFHAIRENNEVVSWGDPRFPSVLGREVNEET